MKAVVDRIVQYANRYQLTNAETGEVLGTFDFDEVTGTVQQVGTEIDKELFDSIAADLAARVKLSGGELAGTIVTFSDISGTATNVASGDTSATLWGKVKNWFSRLKALAFKDKISNSDVASDAAIAQSKISGLKTALDAKANDADLAAIAKSGKLSDATEDATHRVVTDTEKAAWNGKQNALTFDTTPTANSSNPVTSGGVKTALDAKANDADLAAIAKSGDLADATEDATHRVVTDTEKAAWNAKQNAITGGASTIVSSNLTESRALVSDASGKVAVSDVTATELGYLDGVSSNLQTQLDDIKDGTTVVGAAENDEDGNNIPTTYAKQDGDYETLGAGYLPYWNARAESSGQVGWHLIGTIENRAPYGSRVYSCIVLVNGTYPQQGEDNAEESGILEIDVRLSSTAYTGTHLSVLSGNINPDEYCAVTEGTTLKIYTKIPLPYATRTFVIQSEMIEMYLAVGTLQTQDTFYGASAPSGAVYAVIRNEASGAQYISKRSFLNGQDTGAGWYKIMDFSCSSTGYDVYSCILLVNGIYNTQNIETVEGGKAPSGLLEIDLRAGNGGANGQIAPRESCLSILAGNLHTDSLALTFSGQTASLYIRHYTAIPQYQFVVLGERGEYENTWTSAFTSEFIGTSAPSGAEYAVKRNEASDSDALGGKPASEYVTTDTTQTITGAKTFKSAIYRTTSIPSNSNDTSIPTTEWVQARADKLKFQISQKLDRVTIQNAATTTSDYFASFTLSGDNYENSMLIIYGNEDGNDLQNVGFPSNSAHSVCTATLPVSRIGSSMMCTYIGTDGRSVQIGVRRSGSRVYLYKISNCYYINYIWAFQIYNE